MRLPFRSPNPYRDRYTTRRLAVEMSPPLRAAASSWLSPSCSRRRRTAVDTAALAKHLWERRRIIVVPILHEEFQGLRVTANVYSTLAEVDAFADEMERVIANGLPA